MMRAETRYGAFEVLKGELISNSLLTYGEWAQNEIDIIGKFVASGDVVADVGAFIGTHARAMSSMVGPDGVVHAFEPNPIALDLLRENIRLAELTNIAVHPVALSNRDGVAMIAATDPTNLGATRYVRSTGKGANQTLQRRLDSFKLHRVDFIKADMEGEEFNLLQGAARTIASCRPIIFVEILSLAAASNFIRWAGHERYSSYGVISAAFNSANFRRNEENVFGEAKECGLLLIPEERASSCAEPLRSLKLASITSAEDIALVLLHKPQYAYEVLGKTPAAQSLGISYPSPAMTELRRNYEVQIAEYRQRCQTLQSEIQALDAARLRLERDRLQQEVEFLKRESEVTTAQAARERELNASLLRAQQALQEVERDWNVRWRAQEAVFVDQLNALNARISDLSQSKESLELARLRACAEHAQRELEWVRQQELRDGRHRAAMAELEQESTARAANLSVELERVTTELSAQLRESLEAREREKQQSATALVQLEGDLNRKSSEREIELLEMLAQSEERLNATISELHARLASQEMESVRREQTLRRESEELKRNLSASEGARTRESLAHAERENERERDRMKLEQEYRRDLAILEVKLASIESSWSWRLTAPLREVGSLFNRRSATVSDDSNARRDARPAVRHVEDLVALDDVAFVDAAYQAILGRDPDVQGRAHYRAAISEGADRLEILRQIRMSPEGAKFGSSLPGLEWRLRRLKWMRRLSVRRLFSRDNGKVPKHANAPQAVATRSEEVSRDDRELIASSDLFDADFYLKSYPDVAVAGLDPVTHYMEYGWKEGRNPSAGFHTRFYLSSHPDVHEANMNPLVHFIRHGIHEKRLKRPCEALPDVSLARRLFNKERLIPHMDWKRIDIVIPIYNGLDYLEPLFSSILRNSTLDYRLIVVNDCSPDPRIIEFIRKFEAENKDIALTIIDNETNLGFVGSVNKAIPFLRGHFVLLNTDTEVPPAWLERLMYPIFFSPDVASTTPFTNSGTICSFPNFLEDNAIFADLEVETVDGYFQQVVYEESCLAIPTGVGFCMGVNKEVVDRIGMFDPVFGRGYGEENDWCMRARRLGYRNLHVPNLFVYHKHGGSFTSAERQQLINTNLALLRERHPTYDHDVQQVITANGLRTLRDFLVMIIASNEFETSLFIDNELGGGAHQYRINTTSELLKQGKAVAVVSVDRREGVQAKLDFSFKAYRCAFSITNAGDLIDLLDLLKVRELIVNSVVSFPDVEDWLTVISKMKSAAHCKLVYMVHDYFALCPSYTLINDKNAYCGVPHDLRICDQCLERNENEFKMFEPRARIVAWRHAWGRLLQNCDEIVIFARASIEIIRRAYPNLDSAKIVVRPHNIAGRFPRIYKQKSKRQRERIGILGGINTAKGSLVVQELVRHIDSHGLNAKVILFGEINLSISSESFEATGRYEHAELPALVSERDIDVFLVPSVWPETYSFTTDEIIQMGFPLIVFNVGAPAERVRNYTQGQVIEVDELHRTIFGDCLEHHAEQELKRSTA